MEPRSQQRPRHAGDVHVVEEDPAPGTVDEGQEGEQQRRLPGAAASADRDPLAGLDAQADVLEAPRGGGVVPGTVGGMQVLESQRPSRGPVGGDLDGRDDLLLGRRVPLERLDPRDRAQGRLQGRPGADEVRQPGAQGHEVQEGDADGAAAGAAARGHRHAHDDDRQAGHEEREHEPQPGLHGEEEVVRLLRPVEALAELGEQQRLPPVGADGGEAGARLGRLGLQPGLGLQVQLPELLGRAEVDVLDEEQRREHDGHRSEDVHGRDGDQDRLGDDVEERRDGVEEVERQPDVDEEQVLVESVDEVARVDPADEHEHGVYDRLEKLVVQAHAGPGYDGEEQMTS